ncbi:MAG: response regulator, partial [Proteobacteria bacterium]|nr:response regulator [Pseudomonadota bacterium]
MKPDEIGILIVDDEASVRDSLHQWFKADGYRVDTTDDASGALRKLQESPWDIILLDIKMPGMDGIELQRRIKHIDSNIVTIIITAHASVDTAVQALKEGAFDYVTKPIDPEDLGRLVRNAVDKRRLLAENIRLRRQIEEKLIESSVDGVVVADREGKILIFNKGAETILGYNAEEAVGKLSMRDIYFGCRGKLPSFPLLLRRKDGELIESEFSASIVYDEKGNESVTVGVFKDMREKRGIERELRQTREALIQAEKLAAMGRLTSQIAHELNNPIYGIMNTLELLKTEVPPESKRRNILELSLSETVRLSEMLRSMLSFSKPEEEKRVPVRINELIEGILLVMGKQLREANVRVTTAFSGEIPEIMASANQIRQVMLNVIKNAKESMPSGGTLIIRTMPSAGNVRIVITDTGMGIPEALKDKIFEAFFTTKQKVKGTGLGLS